MKEKNPSPLMVSEILGELIDIAHDKFGGEDPKYDEWLDGLDESRKAMALMGKGLGTPRTPQDGP